MRTVALAVLVVAAACGKDHDHAAGRDDHGHDHGTPADDDAPAVAVTVWTDRTELFAEYPALIVGAASPLHAHVTVLDGFRALEDGEMTAVVVQADGSEIRGKVDAVLRSGIFTPAVTPTVPGPCTLRVIVGGPVVQDDIAIEECVVHADLAAARAAHGEDEEPAGRISYLKEDQWQTSFATVPAADRDLQDGVRASGEIRPVAGRHAVITAPAAGRIAVSADALAIGGTVKAGQTLATMAPRVAGADRATLAADVAAADAELQAAEAALARAQRLLADKAGSQRAVEEAQVRVDVARARRDGARGRLGQYQAGLGGGGRGGVAIKSPLAGTIVAVDVASGQSVEEGQRLFEVMDLASVWVVANVFEHDLPAVDAATAARLHVPGRPDEIVVAPPTGRLVTIGRVLDPATRTAPVIFELADPDGRLRIGQTVDVVVATGPARRALAIPDTAILDDGGRSVVFVMVEGEAFERRTVRLGIRSGGWVEVVSGVAPGERVVTEGAYEVKLAMSSGSIPAHGHAH
jgi:membrane fusion protein, heavy metal efflux system